MSTIPTTRASAASAGAPLLDFVSLPALLLARTRFALYSVMASGTREHEHRRHLDGRQAILGVP